ncbi:MAG TPA: hypothetical protein VJ596_09995 [Gemmatimonadaceae bacterium]|nr:hypothetical protein [Gemmatimonadaceae bacterium]
MLVLALVLVAACSAGDARERAATAGDTLDVLAFDTLALLRSRDSVLPRRRTTTAAARPPRLSPLADSIGQKMVFMSKGIRVHTAAARARRLLLDLGRIDVKVETPERKAAYQQAVVALAPVKRGDRFRLNGPWGGVDATVTGFDVWNGRIVATLGLPPAIDSIVRRRDPLVATAVRADSIAEITADTCGRDSVRATLVARLPVIRDSIERALRADTSKLTARERRTMRIASSHAVGCFGVGRLVLIVTMSARDYAVAREMAVLVDDAGKVVPVRLADFRFRAHRALHALDADGDGVDDLAALGRARRVGGTEVLRFDPEAKRFEFVTAGFAWEGA